MTNQEFSSEFDVMIGRYSLPGISGNQIAQREFDEYEKSVFLTQAQESIVHKLYNGQIAIDGFEGTEQCRRFLSELIKTKKLNESTGNVISNNSKVFELPDDIMFITYEQATLGEESGCHSGEQILVVPVTQDEYGKLKKNPFRGPSYRRALRLDIGDNKVEIISNYDISDYQIRYLAKPTPIILVNLGDMTIGDGNNGPIECSLNPILHKYILEEAVTLALGYRNSNSIQNNNTNT